LNEGKVVGGKPVTARRHPTTLFDPVKEPLDPVASAVEIGAEADRIAAVAFRRSGFFNFRCIFFSASKNRVAPIWHRQVWVMNRAFLMTSRAFEHQVGRPKPSEGGGMRETPPHVSYEILCLSSSQEID
jgi:hypothetical protein